MNPQKRHTFLGKLLLLFFAATCCFMLHEALDMSTQELRRNTLATLWASAGLLLLAVCLALSKRPLPRLNATDCCVTALFAWMTVIRLLSDGLRAGNEYDDLMQAAMIYIALRIIFSAERYADTLLLMILCGFGIHEAWTGIGQAYGFTNSNHGLFKITGTFFNPGPYAGFIAPLCVCAAAYIVRKHRFVKQALRNRNPWRPGSETAWLLIPYALCWFTVLSVILILPATMSRAALLAAVSGGVLIAARNLDPISRLRRYHINRPIRTYVFMIGSLILLSAAATGAYHIKRPSAEGRLLIWKIDTRIMVHNPLCGVGLGNFSGAYGTEQASYFEQTDRPETEIRVAGCPESGFNEYLEFGAETGIIGLVLLLLTVGTALYGMIRRNDPFGYGLFAAAVFACFSYPWSVLPLRLSLVMLLAGVGRENAVSSKQGSQAAVGLLLAGCIACLPGLFHRYADRIEALRQWGNVRIWLDAERYDYLVEDGARLHNTLQGDFRFLYDYGYALHKTGDYRLSNEVLAQGMQISCDPMFWNITGKNFEALQDNQAAEAAYLHAYHLIPHRIYPLYLLSRLYVATGQTRKARHTAQQALLRTPKIESIQTRSMQRELREMLDSLQLSNMENPG